MPESFFNEAAGHRPITLLKKRLWHRSFPVNFAKFLSIPFLTEHLQWLLLHSLIWDKQAMFFWFNPSRNVIKTSMLEEWNKLTLFFHMFPFDHRQNIRKSLVCCFQVNPKGTLERKGLTQGFEKKCWFQKSGLIFFPQSMRQNYNARWFRMRTSLRFSSEHASKLQCTLV